MEKIEIQTLRLSQWNREAIIASLLSVIQKTETKNKLGMELFPANFIYHQISKLIEIIPKKFG